MQEQAAEGQLDSSGHFTIGWERAVSKLRSFQAGDAESYLLFLVSAGRAFGARNISIQECWAELRVIMHGAYVSLGDVKRGFEAISAGNAESDTLDLAMGLHGGLRKQVRKVSLGCVHPSEPCYRWTLTPEKEQAEPSPEYVDEARVTVTFIKSERQARKALNLWERLFGTLGGYVGMGPACRMVDGRCDRADIPISINKVMVSRQLNLPTALLAAQVGKLRGVRFHSQRVLKLPKKRWRGALVLQSGELHLVVNAVAYPPLAHPSLSGTVWVQLNRDLSRQRIVEDGLFSQLSAELDQVVARLTRAEQELMDESTPEPESP